MTNFELYLPVPAEIQSRFCNAACFEMALDILAAVTNSYYLIGSWTFWACTTVSPTEYFELLVFSYHVIKPKNCNQSINKVRNKGFDI